jgi:hypothetical protein
MIKMKTAMTTREGLATPLKVGCKSILDNDRRYIRNASVKLLSMISASFENRFVMRPSGVVSKNDIGARKVRLIADWSITLLAFVPAIVRVMENQKMRSV